MGQVITIGLDIAKSVFQVHGVDAAGGCCQSNGNLSPLRRSSPQPWLRLGGEGPPLGQCG